MGFAQASEVSGERRVLVCSGQGSVDEEGHPLHAGDMRAQVSRTMDNLEAVLREAGMGLSDVVRLNHYMTHVDAFFGAMDLIAAPAWRGPALFHAAGRDAPSLPGDARRD